ncbi:MAG: YraN family protein [Candidatus Paceibacterota bacterium]
MKQFNINYNKVGKLGEDIACRFLEKRFFKILNRNYRKNWGEIDIVAENKDIIHFIEVKTVTRENFLDVSDETNSNFRPEDNVHPWKLKRLSRVIQTYLLDYKLDDKKEWQFDVVTVLLNQNSKEAKVKLLSNIIID